MTGFGAELRRWRGLRHVSQLDLANLAGTTQRHVSFMEQGRSRPGRAIVVRLAEALGLSLRERNGLLLSAGFAPVFAESSLDSPLLAPVRHALDAIIEGHMPYPAVVLRPYGELVAANKAMDVLLHGMPAGGNVLRFLLAPDGLGRDVVNLAQWGRHIVDNLRARAVRSPDPRLDALVVELDGLVPAAAPSTDHLGFAVPLRLRRGDVELSLITTITSFATATDVTLSELHLEAFLPADAVTADFLRGS